MLWPRAEAPLVLDARQPLLSTSPTHMALSSKPAACCSRIMGQTDDRQMDRSSTASLILLHSPYTTRILPIKHEHYIITLLTTSTPQPYAHIVCTMGSSPSRAAECSGVSPFISVVSSRHPAPSRCIADAMLRRLTAKCSGLQPRCVQNTRTRVARLVDLRFNSTFNTETTTRKC